MVQRFQKRCPIHPQNRISHRWHNNSPLEGEGGGEGGSGEYPLSAYHLLGRSAQYLDDFPELYESQLAARFIATHKGLMLSDQLRYLGTG